MYSQEAVKSYGWIFKTVKWDDVHVADNLLKKGKEYLTDIQFAQITLTISAVDLHMLHVDMERIKVLDRIRVTSTPNGLDRFFPVSEMTIYLDKPSNNKLTLGTSYSKNSLSTKTESNMTSIKDEIDSLPNKSEILEEARENASQLIHSATNGHVVTTADEQLIMDTADKKTARKLWRWNLNGLGYSKTGYNGKYDTAITMDGQIVGERLVGGSVTADKLSVSYKSSVEKQITDAIDDSNDYTDKQLKSYWTRVEVETAIKNTKDAVLISAKETATSYTDDKLKSYSTSAQIKVKTDSIESEVKKKLNSSDLSTKIQQNASAVKIAWNNISKYIQFESGELRIYDSAVSSSQKLVSKFNYNGCHFYRNDYYVGKIGTNELQSDSSKKGLNFDLESNGAYMTWASKDSSSANVYTINATSKANTAKSALDSAITSANTARTNLVSATTSANNAESTLKSATSTAQTATASANDVKKNLDSSISSANSAKSALDTAISNAKTAKSNLDTSTSTGNTAKNNLDTAISNATKTRSDLNAVISSAQSAQSSLSGVIAQASTAQTNLQNATNSATNVFNQLTAENVSAKANLDALRSEDFNAQEILSGVTDIRAYLGMIETEDVLGITMVCRSAND